MRFVAWFGIAFLTSLVLGCNLNNHTDSSQKFEIIDTKRKELNLLIETIRQSNGDESEITIFYPPSSIILGSSTNRGDHRIEFENVFELIDFSSVLNRVSVSSNKQRPSSSHGIFCVLSDSTIIEFGKFGTVGYAIKVTLSNKPNIQKMLDWFFANNSQIHQGFVPRVEVKQNINDIWTKLTCFRTIGVRFLLAPQDNIELAMSVSAMKALYYPTFIEIRTLSENTLKDLRWCIKKPIDGFWPHFGERPIFFEEFEEKWLDWGDSFTWAYCVFPPIRQYSFDVFVVEPNNAYSFRQIVNFMGPNMLAPEKGNAVSYWPINPEPDDIGDDCIRDPGYPGGAIVPEWAARKLLELGWGYVSANSVNRKTYAALFDSVYGAGNKE